MIPNYLEIKNLHLIDKVKLCEFLINDLSHIDTQGTLQLLKRKIKEIKNYPKEITK